MHHFTCWTLFISRINGAWLYKCHEDSGWQLNVDLAQLVRHWPKDLEVLVSNPTGGNFWRILFCSSLCKDLSDNSYRNAYREKLNCFRMCNEVSVFIWDCLFNWCIEHYVTDGLSEIKCLQLNSSDRVFVQLEFAFAFEVAFELCKCDKC